MADPRFVGVHWFQWLDQSAAGRKNRENHKCGFVDVTCRVYPEFVETVTQATAAMYPVRASGERSPEKILEAYELYGFLTASDRAKEIASRIDDAADDLRWGCQRRLRLNQPSIT